MRGSGYAIGEILIFLAIAAIIGFLIGWLVFYRRPDKTTSGLAPTNPNHVKRLEERARTADAKVIRIEKRANLLLESLSKATPPKAPAAAAAPGDAGEKKISIAPAAAAPEAKADSAPAATDADKQSVGDKTEAAKQAVVDKVEATKGTTADKVEASKQAPADKTEATKGTTADKVEASKQAPADKTEAAKPADGDKAKAAKPAAGKKPAAPEATKEATPTKDDGVDDYLSEADDRISKLEETLDKLSKKLAELEDD